MTANKCLNVGIQSKCGEAESCCGCDSRRYGDESGWMGRYSVAKTVSARAACLLVDAFDYISNLNFPIDEAHRLGFTFWT